MLLYDYLTHKESVTIVNIDNKHSEALREQEPTTSARKINVKEGVISLSACRLLMIELGPVSDKRKGKYTLQIISDEDGSVIDMNMRHMISLMIKRKQMLSLSQ